MFAKYAMKNLRWVQGNVGPSPNLPIPDVYKQLVEIMNICPLRRDHEGPIFEKNGSCN